MAKPAAAAASGAATATARPRRKERKNIIAGVAHVNASFNNTIVTITDAQGNTIAWSSSGQQGFKGSRKSTPFAAQMAAEGAGRKAMEHGMRTLEIQVRGPGSGRESALRALQAVGLAVTSIRDVTPIPWMYCSPTTARLAVGMLMPAIRAKVPTPSMTYGALTRARTTFRWPRKSARL